MQNLIEKIKNKSPEYLLNKYCAPLAYPISISSLADRIGFELKGLDFVELERKPGFKERVKENGHIVGAISIDDESCIIAYNTQYSKEMQRFFVAYLIAFFISIDFDLENDQENDCFIFWESSYMDNHFVVDFADRLLVPSEVVVALVCLNPYSMTKFNLAKKLLVPMDIVKRRVKYLFEYGVIPKGSAVLR